MMSGTSNELDMLKRQVGNLDIYATELQHLEEWCRPPEYRERALKIRSESAPMFFNLVVCILRDALIQGISNILDKPSTFGKANLTLEYVIENHPDPAIKTYCVEKLMEIRNRDTYTEIKIARKRILSHSDYATIINYDALAPKHFSNLTLKNLQSLVDDIGQLISKMAGQTVTEFTVQDWKGVKVLFNLLAQK